MINRTDAWACTNGKCFADKQSAYNEEVLHLYQTLPKVGNRGVTAAQFKKMIQEVNDWLNKATGLQRQMADERDVEVIRSIAGQGT